VTGLASSVNGYVRDLHLSDYSKTVLLDLDDRLQVLGQYTRPGTDDKQVVLRGYLPSLAAHNLALGTHLALLETPGVASARPGAAAAPAAERPLTVAEKLKKKISLSFPRNTLEKSMEMLGEEVGVPIVIMGSDLQLDGITKNQSFGLDERDKPADEILRKIMLQANPAGKLIYVIKPKEEGGEDVLHITTRAAAAKRGDTLPPELVLPDEKKK
jgi:hypothetical protein